MEYRELIEIITNDDDNNFDHNKGVENSLSAFVKHIDDSRKRIIAGLEKEGYIVRSDLRICEIPNFLVYFNEALVVCTTISTKEVKMQRAILDAIPDLHVIWDYDENKSYTKDDLKQVTLKDNLIQHEYSSEEEHTFALFSFNKLEKISSNAFYANTYIKKVKLTPVVTEIGYKTFYETANLEEIEWGRNHQGKSNIKKILQDAVFNTKLTSIEIPNSVEVLDGADMFYSPITSLTFEQGSKLKELRSNWIFNFQDRYSDNWITIPKGQGVRFYDSIGREFTTENARDAVSYYGPFTRCYNKVKIEDTSPSCAFTNDDYGVVYQKDTNGNKVSLINLPGYNLFEKGYTIPNTVKYIGVEAFNSHNNFTETIQIPSTIEYIYPAQWVLSQKDSKVNVDDNNKYYKHTNYGGLLTKSKQDNTDYDVLIYEPTISIDTYDFPDNFTSLNDFNNYRVSVQGLFSSKSIVKTIRLNKKLPMFYNEQLGPFSINPKEKFEYLEASCDNYIIEDNGQTLYMRKDNNWHHTLIGTSVNIESLKLHEDCKEIIMSICNSRENLSYINFGNVERIDCESGFTYNNKIKTLEFSNSLKYLFGWMLFLEFNFEKIIIGTNNQSNFESFGVSDWGSNTTIFKSNIKLSSIVIYSEKVNKVSESLFAAKDSNEADLTIYIPFYKDDGITETTTYQTFKRMGYPEETYYNKVRIKNISTYTG